MITAETGVLGYAPDSDQLSPLTCFKCLIVSCFLLLTSCVVSLLTCFVVYLVNTASLTYLLTDFSTRYTIITTFVQMIIQLTYSLLTHILARRNKASASYSIAAAKRHTIAFTRRQPLLTRSLIRAIYIINNWP